jgi:hypothetical protein
MEKAEKKIIKVLTNIINRLDDLEIEQHKNKEMFSNIKERLLDLNSFVNDILDIVNNEEYENDELLEQKLSRKYSNLRDLIDKEFDDEDNITELKNQVIGES